MLKQLQNYLILMRLHRPIGILLLLWPTLWALWIASQGQPNSLVLIVFIAGAVVMRSAGCVINDFADRNFDGKVTRTKDRPIVSRKVTSKEALIIFIILSLLSFGLVLLLNSLTILLSLVAIALAIIYPFAKRFIYLPQLILGAAFAWAIPMAFAAQTNSVPLLAWYLYLIGIIWPMIYDTMYAMVDRADDLEIGVKSTAILFGNADRCLIGLLQIIMIVLLVILGLNLSLGRAYYFGITIAVILALYQQYLIKDRIPEKCFKAFLNNNWLGLAIFTGLMFEYWV